MNYVSRIFVVLLDFFFFMHILFLCDDLCLLHARTHGSMGMEGRVMGIVLYLN